jgi:hypothetical protein
MENLLERSLDEELEERDHELELGARDLEVRLVHLRFPQFTITETNGIGFYRTPL